MRKIDYDNASDLHIMCEALKKADRLNSDKIKALAYAAFAKKPEKVMVSYNFMYDIWTIRLHFDCNQIIDLEV